MIRIGKKVKIIDTVDSYNPSPIEMGDIGTVVSYEIDCGATEENPLHIVWVKDKGKDSFWKEELKEL